MKRVTMTTVTKQNFSRETVKTGLMLLHHSIDGTTCHRCRINYYDNI